MTASLKLITQEHLDAARDAVLGLDPSQAPTDASALNERLSLPQEGVTQSLDLLLKHGQAKHLSRAAPLVYTLLEAANRAFPAEMKEELRSKTFVGAIAAVGGEARGLIDAGAGAPSPTGERQPVLAAFIHQALLTPGALPPSLSHDDRIGLVALSLGALRAIDRHLAGAERPAVAVKEPGRNDPCSCGSGKKFKKCHGGPGAAAA
jgi:hypothetical protein